MNILLILISLHFIEEWPASDAATSQYATVLATTYYTPFGIANTTFQSMAQDSDITVEDFAFIIGGESDTDTIWPNRVSFECQQDAIQVDTYGMLIGVNMTIPIPVNDTFFSAPSCYISIHNDFGNELIDVGAWGINGSCMTVTNVSTPGTFGMAGFCDGLSHCSMSRRRNCLEKDTMFDTKYRSYSTPLVSYSTKRLEISANTSSLASCGGNATYHWRMLTVEGGTTVSSSGAITQPNSNTLTFPAQTLAAGLYIVFLEIELTDSPLNDTHDEDYLYIRVIQPEIVANLKGATMRESNGSESILFDASASHDPVTNSSDILTTQWSVLSVPGVSYTDQINCIATFPGCQLLQTGSVTWHTVYDGFASEYLELDTSIFQDNSTLFVIFTISRGDRVASAIQSVYISTRVTSVLLRCMYNCRPSAQDKMALDKLELDLIAEGTNAVYKWSALRLVNESFELDHDLSTKFDTSNRTLFLPKRDVDEGVTYLFNVVVTLSIGGAEYVGRAGYVKTVNFLPYGGYCTVNKYAGSATIEKFKVRCFDWLDEGERISRDPVLDQFSVLSYAITQTTEGAYLREETVLVSDSNRMELFLKAGNPNDDHKTVITVRIIDVFDDAATVNFTLTSSPTIDITAISADSTGAELVQLYMDDVRKKIDKKTAASGKILSVIKSAADQLVQIPVPRKPSEVAKTLDGEEGVLLDINIADDTNNNSITFQEYYQTSIENELDPATAELQQGFEYLASKAYTVLDATVISGDRVDDQRYLNLLSQLFTNLIVIREYANTATKNYVVAGLQVLGVASGSIWVENDGLTAEEEEGENVLIDMTGSTINSVVPNDLNQARIVYNMNSARNQIDDMVVISGSNMTQAIINAQISPSERAYLYLKVQEKLKYDLNSVRDLARSSTASIRNVSKSILSTTEVCIDCVKYVGTGLNRQTITSRAATDLASTTLTLNSASVRLNSIGDYGNQVENVMMMRFEKNIFMYDSDGTSSQIVGGVTHLELSDGAKIHDSVTFEQHIDHVNPKLVTPVIRQDDVSKFSLHKFIYRNTKDSLCINVKPDSNDVDSYNVYLKFSEAPTILTYDMKRTVDSLNNWQVCIAASDMKQHTGMTFLGIQTKFVSSQTSDNYPSYWFTLVTVACMNWEEDSETWRSDQCELEWIPNEDKIRCECSNIKDLTFGNSFLVAPNTIDFSTVFLKFSPLNQAAVIAAICVVFLMYIIVVVWARRKDRFDIFKWGVTPLMDNFPNDQHLYIIKVYTGFRINSATDSQILFQLSGDRRDTGVRRLTDGIRTRFEKGSVMQFLMTTHSSVGLLTHLRIWHDNSGKGDMASWYLSKIIITDLQSKYSYTFICEDWISVETSNTSMDKLLFVANPELLQSFSHLFSVQTKGGLIDGHLWTSILYRPTFSNFTRVQRATCALMALMLAMLANAMYFNPEDNYETSTSVEVGPLRFSLQQVFVALICALIITPPTLLVITIFKRSKRRVPVFCRLNNMGQSPNVESYEQMKSEEEAHLDQKQEGGWRSKWSSFCCSSSKSDTELLGRECTVVLDPDDLGFQCPFWFSFIGWAITICAVLVSAFFILLYSMEWGKQKTEEWLTTFLISMLQSVIVIDPVLIVAIAFCLALVCRSLNNTKPSTKYSHLDAESRLAANEVNTGYTEPPLSQAELEEAKRKRTTEIRQRRTVIELISNVFFLWVIFSISYSNRDDRTYQLHETIINMMNANPSLRFDKINTTAGFYDWLQYSAIPSVLPTKDYSDELLHWTMQEYLTDQSNYRLGPPRLRQLRTRHEDCFIPHIEEDACYRGYSIWSREDKEFCLQWRDPPCPGEETVYNHSSAAWKYLSADPFSGTPLFGYMAPYEYGGYYADLDVNRNISMLIIDELYSSLWVDRQTRAVILEFTVYCPSVNVFAFSMFMVEFPETGGAIPSFSIFPVRVYQHDGSLGVYIVICECLALLYCLVLLVWVGLAIFEYKCGFYKQFWIVFDIGILMCSVTAIVFYIIRLYTAQMTVSSFKDDKRVFVDFYQVAFWDQLFISFLGLVVFMATIRCLKALEGNKQVYIVARIFYKLANDMLWLGIMLIFVFVVFAVLGHLLFGTKILSYMSIYKALTTLFLTVIGKSKFAEINETDPILAKFYFSFFVFVVSMLMFSVFLTSLCTCIQEISKGLNEGIEDVFMLAVDKLIRFLKGKGETETEVEERELSIMDETSFCSSVADMYTNSDMTIEELL